MDTIWSGWNAVASRMTLTELRRVSHAINILAAQSADPRDDNEVAILVRETTGDSAPWVEFAFNGRQFGIWRTNGAIYEANEYGAMGEDELTELALPERRNEP